LQDDDGGFGSDQDLKMSELSIRPKISGSRLASNYQPGEKTTGIYDSVKKGNRMEMSDLNYSQDMFNSNSRNVLTDHLTPTSQNAQT
jgi:hypothetical protein